MHAHRNNISGKIESFIGMRKIIDHDSVRKQNLLQLEKVKMPLFTGGIRDYPRFKMDFQKHVMPTINIESAPYILRSWQTRTYCCRNIVAHDVSLRAQTWKHLLRTRNISEQNQKHFLCPGHKICIRNKCCARGQTGKQLCRQQCVRNNCPHLPVPLVKNRLMS